MKVGDYVRTKYGIKKVDNIVCGQDVRFDNTDGFDDDLKRYHDYDGISFEGSAWREIVERTSPNIIDLIEVGDFIKYNPVQNHYAKKITLYKAIKDERDLLFLKYQVQNDKLKILSIVTKEQFSEMEYKVGDNK